MHKLIALVLSVGLFAVANVAAAHSFVCEKTVNGEAAIEVSTYPTTVTFHFNVINNHESLASTYDSVSDPSLAGFSFQPAAPYEVPYGQSVSDDYEVVLNSHEDCMALAAADGTPDDMLVNTLTVTWHGGQTTCSAKVTCMQPPPPPPPPPPEGEATRTPGFYKTHLDAIAMCMEGGPIDLGNLEIGSVEEALGLLWATPAKYTSGDKRSALDRTRFILARHTLVGYCNLRLFGTLPSPSTLLGDAVDALAGTDCEYMHWLAEAVDDYNNSGDDEPFPEGFDPGHAQPRQAASIATDPTSPSGGTCGG